MTTFLGRQQKECQLL